MFNTIHPHILPQLEPQGASLKVEVKLLRKAVLEDEDRVKLVFKIENDTAIEKYCLIF